MYVCVFKAFVRLSIYYQDKAITRSALAGGPAMASLDAENPFGLKTRQQRAVGVSRNESATLTS
jgi:hypothetical protein